MIFVTGGSGLVGSYLIPALLSKGLAVRALYRKTIPQHVTGFERVEWVEGDVRDSGLLREALAGVTHVFHCAGLVSYAPQDEELLRQVNVEGTAAVVDACLERPSIRLCHVSSVAALGKPAENAGPELDENAKWDLGASYPAYASSKYLGELEVWRGITEGLEAVIVNPSVILGATNWERSSTQLFRYAWQEHAFYTPGNVNFVDVRDVVHAMLRLTFDVPKAAGERFILSAGSMPLKEFLTRAATCFNKKPPTTAVPNWAAEVIWRIEHVRGWLTGARPLITKDTARAGRRPIVYKAEKVKRVVGLTFLPIAESIEWCCAALAASPNSARPGAVVVP